MRIVPAEGGYTVEDEIHAAWDQGQLRRGMTLLLEAYGPELRGRLRQRHKLGSASVEVYQMACERMWKAWPRFRWESSCRVWAHSICRHTAIDHLRSPHWRPERNLSLSNVDRNSRLEERPRTRTMEYRRTENKSRMRELIEYLGSEDQMMLRLRVYERLSWRRVALVLEGESMSEEELVRVCARLRKRFQGVVRRLQRLAEDGGLLPEVE